MLGEFLRVFPVAWWTDSGDPRTATGGSAIKAVEVLMEQGVPEERIIFVNLVRYPCAVLSRFIPSALSVDCLP